MNGLHTLCFWGPLLSITLLSCYPQEKEGITSTEASSLQLSHNGIYSLEKLAENYEPSTIDLSVEMEKYLLNSDLIHEIHNSDEDSVINRVMNLFLLKQYIYHLQNANQGYDLLRMRKGKAKIIIDQFIQANGIAVDSEFLNSAIPYILIKRSDLYANDTLMVELMKEIKLEEERILKGH